MHFLVLQDLCNGLDNPCALDVKMGRVTVEPGEREVSNSHSCSTYSTRTCRGWSWQSRRQRCKQEGATRRGRGASRVYRVDSPRCVLPRDLNPEQQNQIQTALSRIREKPEPCRTTAKPKPKPKPNPTQPNQTKPNQTKPNQEKKIGQLKKYPNQPVVGFRYVGMSWSSYFEGDQQPQKLQMQKSWGAGMAVENTGSGLARWVFLLCRCFFASVVVENRGEDR